MIRHGDGATVEAVAFDLMDTVVRDPFREALEGATGRPLAEVFAARPHEGYHRLEVGELTEDEYWASYASPVTVDVATFHRLRRAGYAWMPGMRELLDDLEGVVVRAIASNYPAWIDELASDTLAGRFELVFASIHCGVRKPDPRFFLMLADRLELPPASVLLVDDRDDNVAGALAAGMKAHRFEGVEGVRARLREEQVALPTT